MDSMHVTILLNSLTSLDIIFFYIKLHSFNFPDKHVNCKLGDKVLFIRDEKGLDT